MANYKIKNITKNLEKRNPNFNSNVGVEYIDSMVKKTVQLKPDQEIIMVLNMISPSINRLKQKNMIIIEEINDHQVNKMMAVKEVVKEVPVAPVKESGKKKI